MVREIDLYEFLLSGDTRADIRLLQGDVIFVPVVGKLTAIAGEVRRPAIYELRDEKSLLDLVRVAGGFAPSAFKRRVQVERLEGNIARIVLDTDAEDLETERQPFPLSDGDIVRVLPIVLADENVVTVEGNVYRPGKYEIKPGMTVGSLLPDEKAFLPETYFDYALLTRLVPPDLHKEVIPVNLREIVLEKKKEADVALQGRDTAYGLQPLRLPRPAEGDHLRRGPDGSSRPGQGSENRGAGDHGEDRPRGERPSRESAVERNVLTFEIQAGTRVADLVKMAGGLTRLAVPRARRDRPRRRQPDLPDDLLRPRKGDRGRPGGEPPPGKRGPRPDPLRHGDEVPEDRHGRGRGEQPGRLRPHGRDAPVRPAVQGRRVQGERLHEGRRS